MVVSARLSERASLHEEESEAAMKRPGDIGQAMESSARTVDRPALRPLVTLERKHTDLDQIHII